jgi:hypothetical protein
MVRPNILKMQPRTGQGGTLGSVAGGQSAGVGQQITQHIWGGVERGWLVFGRLIPRQSLYAAATFFRYSLAETSLAGTLGSTAYG